MSGQVKILMCPPDYYSVCYEINPWMNIRFKPEKIAAVSQWQGLSNLYRSLGIPVQTIPPEPDLPDMVFTANAGLVIGKTFIPSNFRFSQRQPEREHFVSWFGAQGYEISPLPAGLCFEGQGDGLLLGNTLLAGYHFRSDICSHELVGEILGIEVISAELTNPKFYHLDTCFCPLNANHALVYPGAFDAYGLAALANRVEHLIHVNDEDAHNFCCNAAVLGPHVVTSHCGHGLRSQLESLGFEVHMLPFDQYFLAGGAAKCLSLILST